MASERKDRQDIADDIDMERIARMVSVLNDRLVAEGFTDHKVFRSVIKAATPEIARKVLNTHGS